MTQSILDEASIRRAVACRFRKSWRPILCRNVAIRTRHQHTGHGDHHQACENRRQLIGRAAFDAPFASVDGQGAFDPPSTTVFPDSSDRAPVLNVALQRRPGRGWFSATTQTNSSAKSGLLSNGPGGWTPISAKRARPASMSLKTRWFLGKRNGFKLFLRKVIT